jgi:hypothetical protein
VSEDTAGIGRLVEIPAVVLPNIIGSDDDGKAGNLIGSWAPRLFRLS